MLKKRLVVLLVSLIIIFFIFSLVSSTGNSENQCYQDSDCGPVTESPIFCSGSDLYKNVTIPECVFYGSPGFICLYSYEKILIQHCDLGCSNNQCNEQELTCVEAKDLGLLTGSIINGLGTVINHANQSFEVGLAVYEKFDENIDNQILFDSETGVVLNQSNLTLSVSLPLCAYQIDLFCGPVLQNFSQGERYAERLISAMHSTSIPLCIDEQEPVCSNGILETGEQCDDGNQNNNDGCSSQCIIETIVCSEDIDCGTDGFIQGPFCLANNVTRQFQNFTCNYPGQYNSFCSSVIENKTLEICNYQCSLGSCIEPICGNNITELGEDCDDGNSIDGDGCSSQCMLEDLQARIIFRKIVCNSESDLPNWASTNITINNQTAQDFINSHQNCYFQENWSFQWWIGKGENNPGDNTGFSPLWHNITPTDSSGKTSVIYPINDVLSRLVWFREVFQSGYVPFTGINTNQNVSAEFYCHDDVQFYDNREGITFTQEGNYAGDYYCIAFNAKNETQPFCGDGIKNGNEQCDDGNLNNNDSCSNSCMIQNITCNQDLECDDSNPLTYDQCINPGTPASECRNTEINCATNLDCGSSGFLGEEFCSQNDIMKNYANYTCINPGTLNSFCISEVQQVTLQMCEFACSEGACIPCATNSQCNDNNSTTVDICVNPGTIESHCENTPISPVIVCNQSSECGITGFIGNEFCSENNLSQNYETNTCINPGTSESFCVSTVQQKTLEVCSYQCVNDSCISPPQQADPIFLIINSPENKIYNTSLILINISSNGSVSFSIDSGENQSYMDSLIVNLTSGSHTLNAYANTSLGNSTSETVVFSIINETSSPTNNTNGTNGGGGGGGSSGTLNYYYISNASSTSPIYYEPLENNMIRLQPSQQIFPEKNNTLLSILIISIIIMAIALGTLLYFLSQPAAE